MRLQIDTENKTIKIEKSINFDELFKNLKKLFPNNEWKEYKLETNTEITYWTSPIYVQNYPIATPYPWWKPAEIICGGGDTSDNYSSPGNYTPNVQPGNTTYISGGDSLTGTFTINSVISVPYNADGNNVTHKQPELYSLTSEGVIEKSEHVYCVEV
jgi:hypothetical protein